MNLEICELADISLEEMNVFKINVWWIDDYLFDFQGVPVIPNPFHFVTFYITYGLVVVQFILTLFADLSALPSKKQGDEKLLEYEEQTPLSNSGMKEGLEQNNVS